MLDKEFDIAPDTATWIEMCKGMQGKHEVQIVARVRVERKIFEGINNEIIYLKSNRIPFFNRFYFYWNQYHKYRNIINSFKPDVVLFNTNNYWLINKASILKKKYSIKLVFDVRTLIVASDRSNKFKSTLEKCLYRRTLQIASEKLDGISYITKEMEKYCRNNYHLSPHKSCAWSSGVDVDLFKPLSLKNLSGDKNSFNIVYHGTVADNRGLQQMINALRILNDSTIFFSIIGDGNGIAELKRLTSKLELNNIVDFVGRVPYADIPQLVNQADIGIIPLPYWDGWNTSSPIKLFEYLACGKPVIATDIPAHRNVLYDSNFVFWAKEAESHMLVDAIIKARKKKSEFVNLGKEARAFVKSKYTWEKQANILSGFLNDL